MKYILVGPLVALTACGHQSDAIGNNAADLLPYSTPSATPSPVPQSSPSAEDARRAAVVALNRMAIPAMMTGPKGAPKDCTGGMMNGQRVMACKVCATIITAPAEVRSAYDVKVLMVNFLIPFKQAISYDQPDVAPLEGAAGVWVANYPPQDTSPFATKTSPPMEVTRASTFDPIDFEKVGYWQLDNGNFKPMYHRGYPIQHTALNGFRNVIQPLQGEMGLQLVRGKVGLCNGTPPGAQKAVQSSSSQVDEEALERAAAAIQ